MDSQLKLGDDYRLHPPDRAGASGSWLRDRLKAEGVILHSDCGLSKSLVVLQRFRDLVLSNGTIGRVSLAENFSFYSQAHGADFLTKALHWGYDSGLRLTQEQWKQLANGNPNIATAIGTAGDSKGATDRNKVWEAIIGSIAKTFCSRVDFIEPDIVCTFDKKKIAVAAKMPYSNGKIVRRVKEGHKQAIDADHVNNVDASLIFVNVVQIYPLFQVYEEVVRSSIASEVMGAELIKNVMSWCDKQPLMKEARKLAKETNKPVGVGFFIPFTLIVNGNPMPFFYVHMPLTWSVQSDEYLFAQKFLQACNVVLGYPHDANAEPIGAKR